MRLDKFLKVSRLIRRRTLAKEVCDAGRVQVGSRVAKAGQELKVGDVLAIDFGRRQLRVQVLDLRPTARVHEAKELYAVLEETFRESRPPLEDDPE